jgi:hypothetical protein
MIIAQEVFMEFNLIGLVSASATFLGVWIGHVSIRKIEREIVDVTLLWDTVEFCRQQKRIKKGHAPANPNNLRHARILAVHHGATKFDGLARDPRRMAYLSNELDLRKEGTACCVPFSFQMIGCPLCWENSVLLTSGVPPN